FARGAALLVQVAVELVRSNGHLCIARNRPAHWPRRCRYQVSVGIRWRPPRWAHAATLGRGEATGVRGNTQPQDTSCVLRSPGRPTRRSRREETVLDGPDGDLRA